MYTHIKHRKNGQKMKHEINNYKYLWRKVGLQKREERNFSHFTLYASFVLSPLQIKYVHKYTMILKNIFKDIYTIISLRSFFRNEARQIIQWNYLLFAQNS